MSWLTESSEKAGSMLHKFEILNGLLVANLGGQKVVLDTGSPTSFTRRGAVLFGDRVHQTAVSGRLCNADQLSEHAGIGLDGLIGCDVLQEYRFEINRDTDQIAVNSPMELDNSVISVPFDCAPGVPIIGACINDRPIRAVTDTGAARCFAASELLAGTPICASVNEAHPAVGPFTASVHSASFVIGSDPKVSMSEYPIAAVPDNLASMMEVFGIGAIIGLDVMLTHRLIFDFGRRVVSWSSTGECSLQPSTAQVPAPRSTFGYSNGCI